MIQKTHGTKRPVEASINDDGVVGWRDQDNIKLIEDGNSIVLDSDEEYKWSGDDYDHFQ